MTETLNFPSVQYIKLIQDLRFDIQKGRSTVLEKDVPGFLLTEENISCLTDVTEKQKQCCLDLIEEAKEKGGSAALIAGFPCIIGHNQFIKINPLKMYPVTCEII